MSKYISKFIVKRILKETVANNFGKSDPTFESIPTKKLSHDAPRIFTANKKKLRKAVPPGLSERDQEILVKVKRRAYRLDMSLFSLCGIQFGWGSVIGLVPGIGDIFDCMLAIMVVGTASECDLPTGLRLWMFFNIFFDFVIGLVPFLGDLVDAIYKANTRNAILLENYLRQRGQENLRKQGVAHPPPDYSLPEEHYDRPGPSFARGAREPDLEAQRHGRRSGNGRSDRAAEPQIPPKSKSKSNRR